MSKKLLSALLSVLACLSLFLVLGCEEQEVEDIKALDFTAIGHDGQMYNLSDFKGELIFINFFTTWCEPCKEELPYLISLHEEYADRGFQLIFILEDNATERMRQEIVDEFGITQPLLLAGESPLYDNDEYWEFYNHAGMVPSTMVIDQNFNLLRSETIIGERDEPTFRALIEKYIDPDGEPPVENDTTPEDVEDIEDVDGVEEVDGVEDVEDVEVVEVDEVVDENGEE